MPEQKVLVREERSRPKSRPLSAQPAVAWKWLGWLGLLLAIVGLGDFAIAWYPLNLGSPEWEFGTVSATFAGLPLVTMGIAALLGSGLARGTKWLVLVVAWAMLGLGLLIGAMYLIFLLDVPMALRTVEGVAEVGIKKAIVKTSLLGVSFGVAYLGIAVAVLKHVSSGGKEDA